MLLVDPMLNPAEAVGPVEGTAPPLRNPRVGLPMSVGEVIAAAGTALVTHLHNDHFDDAARELLPAGLPILCQPPDAASLAADGFAEVTAIEAQAALPGGVEVVRVPARHTLGEHEEALGPVSGFVVRAPGEPVLYVASDCVWCDELEATLDRFAPDVVVVNAGAARFLTGGPITMTSDDVVAVARYAPGARVVAVHLEALNHCPMTRDELRRHLVAAGVDGRFEVPADGETLTA